MTKIASRAWDEIARVDQDRLNGNRHAMGLSYRAPTRERARITHQDDRDASRTIAFSTGHEIQFGGAGGDGFCYEHQSFDCIDNLTENEHRELEAVA